MEALILYTTWPSDESAKTAAQMLVDARLAACINLWPTTSIYRFEGHTHTEGEVVMWIKTSRKTVQKTIDKIQAIHPYTNPCVLVLPVDGGASAFLAWIATETT